MAEVCAEIADGKEKCLRGELTHEEFDTLKAGLKKRLPVITPHATFRNGRRLNADAVPSGLSMYDVDHIPDPRGYYDKNIRGREAQLGIVACCSSSPQGWTWPRRSGGCPRSWATATTTPA